MKDNITNILKILAFTVIFLIFALLFSRLSQKFIIKLDIIDEKYINYIITTVGIIIGIVLIEVVRREDLI